jgi:hypothetical protein
MPDEIAVVLPARRAHQLRPVMEKGAQAMDHLFSRTA